MVKAANLVHSHSATLAPRPSGARLGTLSLAVLMVGALTVGSHAPVNAQSTSDVRQILNEAPDLPSSFVPLTSFGAIAEEGGEVEVQFPADRPQPFDFELDLPYAAGIADFGAEPNASLSITPLLPLTASFLGPSVVYADFIIQDDPTVASMDGPVSLHFSNVPYSLGATYTLWFSWEPDRPRSFDPTDLSDFVAAPITVQDPTTGGGSAVGGQLNYGLSGPTVKLTAIAYVSNEALLTTRDGYKAPCQTHASVSLKNLDADVSADTKGGNVAKTFAWMNYRLDVSWRGQCFQAGPPSYGAGTGYSVAVRGPNEAPVGLPFYIEVGLAHMGGGQGAGSPDGFGYKDIRVKPSVTLLQPPEGNVRLEKSEVLGYNKDNCTSWPQPLADALAVVPTRYTWSVILHFAMREYCTSKWSKLDEGPKDDRTQVGFKITKHSVDTQFEDGARFTANAAETGEYSMTYVFSQSVYGSVRAHGNPDTGVNVHLDVHTPGAKAAVV